MNTRLAADEVTLAYDAAPVVEALSLSIADGQVTTIIGPNGCGKSTLLRAFARLMSPKAGGVHLNGQAIHQRPTKEVARRLGLLSQQQTTPDAITVHDLVRRGRYPHQGLFQPPTGEDEQAVEQAMALAGVDDLRDRAVDELSSGQRQRVWIAMALAQETGVLLIDEPTTFLDIAQQVEMLDLVRRLNRERGRTVVMVLHDLGQACRYADHLIVMKAGTVVSTGAPGEVLTEALVREVFETEAYVAPDPTTGTPLVLPRVRAGHTAPLTAPQTHEASPRNGLIDAGS